MQTLILCGGRGIRLFNTSTYVPKAMIELGHRPLVWHVMKRYALYGYKDFTLVLGRNGQMIRDYFLNYGSYTNSVRLKLGNEKKEYLSEHQENDWSVTLVDTGDEAMSGSRIARCKEYISGDEFMITYADCLADIDLEALLKFHRDRKTVATITGIAPPYREGEFTVEKNLATGFYDAKKDTKSQIKRYINGGFVVFSRKIFDYLTSFSECKLETEIFSKLIEDKQLSVYPHHGFWRWLDTDRDYIYLNDLVDKNKMYWLSEETNL